MDFKAMSKEEFLAWLGPTDDEYEAIGRVEPAGCLVDVRETEDGLVVNATPTAFFVEEGYMYDGPLHIYEFYKAGFSELAEGAFESPFETIEETQAFLDAAGFVSNSAFSEFLDECA